MKCPYCEETMEKGYIQASRTSELIWSKNRSRVFLTPDDIDIQLTQQLSFLPWLEGYICKACSKIILDI